MLKIIKLVGKTVSSKNIVEVICECGKVFLTREDGVKAKKTTSCGCLKRIRMRQLGLNSRTHGLSTIPEYSTWQGMIRRCVDAKHNKFKHYGGRGISVCDRWRHSVVAFLQDMGRRPKGRTLDRIDVNGDYEPGNCRWATIQQQNTNTRRNTVVQ